MLFGGLIVGAVARLALPGPQPIGCIGTIAIGVAGGALGGLLGRGILGGPEGPLVDFAFSVLGAVLLLLGLRALAGRRRL
ncbi:GlsB/YeaQ/YmgE family stress response membrane protein [Egibacter rhizosphaerae]|uniref:GlsB/YeaQ/YmgE family stress response membrane protein n=1 Tax=Egibacter rhizosphaerae TaxID=1670831 RepID=A0A411YL16_9ACTN|nr:GlsB/YeaQ/YmgE family stress response membrane protein [Egibacter rhizosphaerae]